MKFIVKNSKGQPIVLNAAEQRVADEAQRVVNALGYEIDITSLTTLIAKVTEQKFFEIKPSDYMPVRVGEGAWSSQLTTYRSFMLGDEFEKGVVNQGMGQVSVADAGVDSITIQVVSWAKSINWTLIQLQQAAKAGNWDLITAKTESLKKNWDLGVQKVAFLGMPGVAGADGVEGLLTQTGVTSNTSLLSVPISTLGPADLKSFVVRLIDLYRQNCQRTAWPDMFTIPESDYLGLVGQASADFPIKSTLQLLEESFSAVVQKPFKIKPCAYGDVAYANVGTTQQVYALYNNDETSIRMNVPVDFSMTMANSANSFQFSSVGYGQFTGVKAYRPQELLYLKFTP